MEKHHWIPVSLYGLDDQVNIIAITPDKHKTIHQVCNYDYRTYSSMYRTFRRRHNHKIGRPDQAMIEDILRMQGGYLHRYTALPDGLQRLHMQMVNQITKHYQPNHQTQYRWSKLWYEYEQAFKNYHL